MSQANPFQTALSAEAIAFVPESEMPKAIKHEQKITIKENYFADPTCSSAAETFG